MKIATIPTHGAVSVEIEAFGGPDDSATVDVTFCSAPGCPFGAAHYFPDQARALAAALVVAAAAAEGFRKTGRP